MTKEEKLEEAKRIYKTANSDQKYVLERLFPELKESEGERMIQYFKDLAPFDKADELYEKYGFSHKDALAWLEKQGNANKEYWRGYREGKQEILDKYTELGKQGEQKPNYCHHEVDLSGCSEEYRNAYYDGWNNCNMQHSQCKSELDDVVKCLINGMKFYYEDNEEATWGTDKWSMPVKHIIEVLEKYGSQNLANSCKTCKDEQKPTEWSEEDEKCLENAIMYCEWARDIAPNLHCYKTSEKSINWLKSLKDRVQPKQEWSEDDEQTFIKSVEALEDFGKFELADWLKEHKNQFLKPQNTWKPSDGQLECLRYAINKAEKDWSPLTNNRIYLTLKALKEQLLELRGSKV